MERVRVRAPELDGDGGWIGVEALSLAALRGKVVVLDFWTLACVNCQRVVEELRGLERRFAGGVGGGGGGSPEVPPGDEHGGGGGAGGRGGGEHPGVGGPAVG